MSSIHYPYLVRAIISLRIFVILQKPDYFLSGIRPHP